MVENFDEIALSRTVKKIEANLCFCIFGRGIFFLKIDKNTFLRYPVVENFDEIALSRTVKKIEANLKNFVVILIFIR